MTVTATIAMELTTRGLPLLWTATLAAVLSLGVWMLFRRESAALSARPRRWILILRLALVVLATLLLADPALRRTVDEEQRARLLILIDASKSMALRDPFRPIEQLRAEAELLGEGADLAETSDTVRRLRSMTRLELVTDILNGTDARSGLATRLREDFELRTAFLEAGRAVPAPVPPGRGGPVKAVEPTAEWTDLGRPVLDAVLREDRDALAAVLLISDGGHNVDERPEESLATLSTLQIPLYTLGVGASKPPRDLVVAEAEGPRTVFAGDTIRVNVRLEASGLGPLTTPVRVSRDGETLAEARVDLPDSRAERVSTSFPLGFPADREGRWKCTVSVPMRGSDEDDGGGGEAHAENNAREVWIHVIRGKVRVLYLDGSPRWEYRYLRNALENDANIVADSLLVSGPPPGRLPIGYPRDRDALFAFDAIVLGDVAREVFASADLENLRDFVTVRGASCILLAGERDMPRAYAGTALGEILPVRLAADSTAREPETATFSPVLTPLGERSEITRLDPDRERNLELWSRLPPIEWIFRHAGPVAGAEVLASRPALQNAPSGALDELAVLVTRRVGAGKVFFCGVDETWRWRWRVGEEHFDVFWRQVLRWAAADRLGPADSDGVRIGTDALRYEAPAGVHLRALIPGNREPADNINNDDGSVNGDRVDVEVTHRSSGEVFRTRLTAVPSSGGLYSGQLGTGSGGGALPSGEYRARLRVGGIAGYDTREDRAAVDFVVVAPTSAEREPTVRDEKRLRSLSAASPGEYLPLERAEELLSRLPHGRRVVSVIDTVDPWSPPWPALGLLLALLVTEWVLRKRASLP